MKYEDVALQDNESAQCFELWIDDQRSFIEYENRDNKVYLVHTEVPSTMEGRGIASALVEKTFQHLEKQDKQVVPHCAYIQTFLRRHPEWERIVGK